VVVAAVVMSSLLVFRVPSSEASTSTTETLMLRGRPQDVHVYGARGHGQPVIVSSGDGGWMHLGPHIADLLAGAGYFVVGFDVRAYLASFTTGASTLQPEDVGHDYETLAAFASRGATAKPVLIGVSEGAGLSVLAAADARVKSSVAGVIALGLPDINELGWRWKDSVIYVTHGVPDEPTFNVSGVIKRIAPLPLAAIHSTSDEFAPLAQAEHLISLAGEPHKFWVVKASNHRFSGNMAEFDRRLLDAIVWVRQNQP
jgi:pimeloyl-ACP methyl ester carboxylesterase